MLKSSKHNLDVHAPDEQYRLSGACILPTTNQPTASEKTIDAKNFLVKHVCKAKIIYAVFSDHTEFLGATKGS